jgi:stress-induced morphogen
MLCGSDLQQISGPQGSSPAPVVSPDQQKISAELVASMREKIREALQADRVDISDTYGDGRHVSIDVVSKAFEGESSMKRCATPTPLHACTAPLSACRNCLQHSHISCFCLQGRCLFRQRMVYRAIWLELQDTVHAVDAMTTRTPEEAGLA